ncbi:MAG: PilN domain-containing protein [candidate division Zixibacteria bacterium]|nr:PilN domain-containing protein [candidate division Zixibacteria bacterium]
MDMIQINLLPKEFRKNSGKLSLGKTGYYIAGGVVGIILMIVTISFFQMHQISELEKKMEIARFRTQQLQKDIAVVDALIDVKEKLVKRMEAVDRLDKHRTVWVRILADFSRRIPEFMWLSLFEEIGTQASVADSTAPQVSSLAMTKPVSIEGYSFTLNSLANFMIQLMRSNYFTDIEMATVEEIMIQEQKAYNYKVTATLHYLSDEELKKLLEQESGPQLLAGF